MDHLQANVERFNAIANEWDADPRQVFMAQKIARAIKSATNPGAGQTALEFGAGTGLATLIMAPHLKRMTAMDSSPGMLEVLRAKCRSKGLSNVDILEGSVTTALPLGPFDLIYSALTLHHVEDVPGLLRQLALRLSPGGKVALADLDTEDGSFHGSHVPGVAHHGFDRGELGRWLVEAGFSDVQFSTAFTDRHQADDGSSMHAYPIFLAVAART